MDLKHLDRKRVLIVGLGESGLAMVRFCLRAGAQVTVCDTRDTPALLAPLKERFAQVTFVGGALHPDLLNDVDLIGWSPGLSPASGEVANFVAAAALKGLRLDGEMEFFSRALDQAAEQYGYRPGVAAITGTNGKTTTTLLTTHLCKAAGKHAVAAGNVSPAALDALCDALDSNNLPEIWVLELSSFQLETTTSFTSTVAVILNVTQDHLDWHGDMAAYVQAKKKIFNGAALVIENRADVLTQLPKVAAPLKPLTAKQLLLQDPVQPSISFGLDEPSTLGSFGIHQLNGLPWLVEAVPALDEPISKRKQTAPEPLRLNRIMPADSLPIRGKHNQANMLAAFALCKGLGLPLGRLLHGVRTYVGEAHRCERIMILNDVEWFDDSKGTNVGATVAALVGLGKPAVLIAGGDGKGQDFSPLLQAVKGHARHVLLIGRDAPLIEAAISASGIPIDHCATLEQAVSQAALIAQAGDAVLLSPACASFDMFKGYAHRAQVFNNSVRNLAMEMGQVC